VVREQTIFETTVARPLAVHITLGTRNCGAVTRVAQRGSVRGAGGGWRTTPVNHTLRHKLLSSHQYGTNQPPLFSLAPSLVGHTIGKFAKQRSRKPFVQETCLSLSLALSHCFTPYLHATTTTTTTTVIMNLNIISNKTILSFCLAIFICLLSSSTSNAAATATAALTAPSNPGATAIPGSTGLLRGTGSVTPQHHPDRQRLLAGGCRTASHPYRNYCQMMCRMFTSTAHCSAYYPICSGCK
jgi:hypothetical protein